MFKSTSEILLLCQLSYNTEVLTGLEPATSPLREEVTDVCASHRTFDPTRVPDVHGFRCPADFEGRCS